MNLALTSDFPATTNDAVLARMRSTGPSPRIAWIPPFTASGRERFPAARALFAAHGLAAVEYCDIDQEPDATQLDRLDGYDVVYLTGGDPLGFRRNLIRSGLAARLRQCLAGGTLIVGASGGAMQLTRNVSPYRLLTETVDHVVRDHADYEALGATDYELLPHLNRLDGWFLETVRRYSERVPHDVIALADGAAMLHRAGDCECVGEVERFRHGVRTSMA